LPEKAREGRDFSRAVTRPLPVLVSAVEGLRQEIEMTTATEQSAQLPQAAPAKGIQVTDKALVKVRSAMAKEGISPEQGGLRLGVQGGGCSGLSYNIRFDTQPRERDRIFQYGDVRVFVDPKSFIYLHGMILDYQETLMQQGFVFVNPQATKSCGCGTSFSA
jgi:iron-sulfur cluster assembly protein